MLLFFFLNERKTHPGHIYSCMRDHSRVRAEEDSFKHQPAPLQSLSTVIQLLLLNQHKHRWSRAVRQRVFHSKSLLTRTSGATSVHT